MKKKVLPLAVGAAAAVTMSAAQAAMYVNEKGMGEALIFPFYSAENGNNTLINIVNTVDSAPATATTDDTGAWKAVKVRIIEGQNSQEVLDFNLYLSPKDHFSFAISATADGGGMIKTADNSCTVPAIPAEGQPFVNFEYLGDKRDAAGQAKAIAPNVVGEDGYTQAMADKAAPIYDNTGIERTAIGYVEVIEMGQIDPDDETGAVWLGLREETKTAKAFSAAASITHDADGMPKDCTLVNEAWSKVAGVQGTWLGESSANAGRGVSEMEDSWLGGGLYGYSTVINVPQGAAFGYDSVAIDELVATDDGHALHYAPGSIKPNFADTNNDTNSLIYTESGVSFPMAYTGYPAGVNQLQAVNSTIMATEVMNDYVTDADIAATTDWVLTFPTKRYHIDATVPVEPFSSAWTGVSACEATSISVTDREESTPPPLTPGDTPPIFSPPPPVVEEEEESDNLNLCYETTIVQFADGVSAAGTNTLAVGVNGFLEEENGWATISFDPADLFAGGTELGSCSHDGSTVAHTDCTREIFDSANDTLLGLPVVGFAVQKYTNGDAGGAGVLANYAMSTEHKTRVTLSD